jgi:hypothetical protein
MVDLYNFWVMNLYKKLEIQNFDTYGITQAFLDQVLHGMKKTGEHSMVKSFNLGKSQCQNSKLWIYGTGKRLQGPERMEKVRW